MVSKTVSLDIVESIVDPLDGFHTVGNNQYGVPVVAVDQRTTLREINKFDGELHSRGFKGSDISHETDLLEIQDGSLDREPPAFRILTVTRTAN